jgi:hypothetical protein
MKQETLIQVLGLIFLITLTLFYNPLSADFEGKIIFFGLMVTGILIFVIFDLYKSIENNKIRINLFDEKWSLSEKIKNLEDFKR